MHNILKPFYNYLSEKILTYFNHSRGLNAGERFNFYIEEPEDIVLFTEALQSTKQFNIGQFTHRFQEGVSPFVALSIQVNGVELIIVNDQQANENYLTRLRNQVAAQEGCFLNTAILILYSGQLDSLSGGTESLSKKGMPFNYLEFCEKLEGEIKSSKTFSEVNKTILKETLKRKKENFFRGQDNIVDLAPLAILVKKGKLDITDYSLIEMFPHKELETFSGNKVIQEYKRNSEWFEKIQLSIHHGDLAEDLKKDFSEKGLKALKNRVEDGNYKEIDFSNILKYTEKEDQNPIKFTNLTLLNQEEDLVMWWRSEGSTKAKDRKKNVIVFNPEKIFPIQIEVEFDQSLRGANIESKSIARNSSSGRRLSIEISDFAYNENFVRVDYRDPNIKSNLHEFRIWIIDCKSTVFEDIEGTYSIDKTKGHLIVSFENKLCFNKAAQYDENIFFADKDSKIELKDSEQAIVTIDPDNEDGQIPFYLKYDDQTYNFVLQQETILPKVISGLDVWQRKRISQKSFRMDYNQEADLMKLFHKNQIFSVRENFRKDLKVEYDIMACFGYSWSQKENGDIETKHLHALPRDLDIAYSDFYRYFKNEGTCPSITYLDNLGVELASNYVNTFLKCIENLEEGKAIDEKYLSSMFSLGVVFEDFDQKRIKFSPLHPLMVAYQLQQNKDLGKVEVYPSLLKKMNIAGLLPFFKWRTEGRNSISEIYAAKENDHSPEWQYFSNDYKFKQLASKTFIRDLVKQKMGDFVSHFSFLFHYNQNAPLRLSAVNMGDCKSILQGIFDYYKQQLNDGVEIKDLRPVEVRIYGSSKYVTKFEEFAHYEDVDDIKEYFDIDFKSKKWDLKELINQFRLLVDYYISELSRESEYSHLTFFQFDANQIEDGDVVMDRLPSGISLDGLMTDVPSFYDQSTYKTGFGTAYNNDDNKLVKLAKGYNACGRIIGTANPYDSSMALCTNIRNNLREELREFYEHSQWVTFVEPKFDLSFFKNDGDLIIIHYSDQYSNASGYDAITVTQKSKQYEYVLKEFLQEYHISDEQVNQDVSSLINLFNTINGEWLLKLVSSTKNSNLKREKLSLLSAAKTFMALHDNSRVIWIPVSLEEILRISSGAGLSAEDGLFSARNLGHNGGGCDDLLMIGLFEKDGRLQMQLYPLEVKVGINDSSVRDKALKQTETTLKLFNDFLLEGEKTFLTKVYRTFFAKLCIINADKLNLYNIWPEKDWSLITQSYREKLLNDDFVITNSLNDHIGCAGVMLFTKDQTGVTQREIERMSSGIQVVTMLEDDAYTLLLNSIPQINEKFVKADSTLDKFFMLANVELGDNKPEQFPIKPIKHEPEITEEYNHKEIQEMPKSNVVSESNVAVHNEIDEITFDAIDQEAKSKIYSRLLKKFQALRVGMQQVHIDAVEFIEGPAFYRMALYPDVSTTVKKIEGVTPELNLVLGLPQEQSVRIFQDLGTVWMEVPKRKDQCVTVTTEHIWDRYNRNEDFEIPFGMDIQGDVISVDFSSSNSPHLLMAGTTGSGKSVVLDTLIRSAARYYNSDELNMFLIDPKGNELIDFEDLDHVPEPNGESSEDAIELLKRGVDEMEIRYTLFKKQREYAKKAAKDIVAYNENTKEKLKRWIIVLDEYADLIEEDAENKKEIEHLLKRLSQKARAAGIHVVLATQKPLATIVSSSIKANLPGVIALKVKTANDSRVVIDENGAETLAGRGDALFKNGAGQVVRVQCAIHLED